MSKVSEQEASMTQEQLDLPRLRELALKATPGPWSTRPEADGDRLFSRLLGANINPDGSPRGDGDLNGGVFVVETKGRDAIVNAAFIAAANPATFLALLDLAESAGRMQEAVRNHLQARDARLKAVYDMLEEMKAALVAQSTEGESHV